MLPHADISNAPGFPHPKLIARNHYRFEFIPRLEATTAFGYGFVVRAKTRMTQKSADALF